MECKDPMTPALAPGGEAPAARALIRDGGGTRTLDPTPENLRAALDHGANVLWLDLLGATPEASALLSGVFDFHPLAVEDCLGQVEHPKIDDYEAYLYVVTRGLCGDGAGDSLQVAELDLFLGPNYLVTFHRQPLHCITNLWERALQDERYPQRGADGLAHAAIDLLVDDLMPILDKLDATIEELEDEILANPTQKTLARILEIKRATLHLRRVVMPQREMTYRLSRDESPLVRPKTRLYFRDVYDHLVRVADINESLRDLVAGALEIYLTVVSNRMNEVMKVLTLVATIFMPLTLLASIYGMNFRHMPGLEWRYGYFGLLGLMLASATGMLWWFRRRGWM